MRKVGARVFSVVSRTLNLAKIPAKIHQLKSSRDNRNYFRKEPGPPQLEGGLTGVMNLFILFQPPRMFKKISTNFNLNE